MKAKAIRSKVRTWTLLRSVDSRVKRLRYERLCLKKAIVRCQASSAASLLYRGVE